VETLPESGAVALILFSPKVLKIRMVCVSLETLVPVQMTKLIVTHFKILSQNSPRETKEDHETVSE
jgi:hypothetical protein